MPLTGNDPHGKLNKHLGAGSNPKYKASAASGGCLMALVLLPVTALMGALRKLAR